MPWCPSLLSCPIPILDTKINQQKKEVMEKEVRGQVETGGMEEQARSPDEAALHDFAEVR